MKNVLTFLVAMGIIVALGDADCFINLNKPGEVYNGCMMNGKLYPFGHIERTENCYRCSCSRAAMSCCSLIFTPVSYDKENCKIVFNKRRCDYDVVQKNDPSKECPIATRVG